MTKLVQSILYSFSAKYNIYGADRQSIIKNIRLLIIIIKIIITKLILNKLNHCFTSFILVFDFFLFAFIFLH